MKLQDSSEFIGKIYGRLQVVSDLGTMKGGRRIMAICECGKSKDYRLSDLKSGMSTNCGCVRRVSLRNRNMTHGDSKTALYSVWRGMNERCVYAKHVKYNRYGGRGISVCSEWAGSYEQFKKWALLNGYVHGLELDRKDNDGNYSPENCRWVTKKTNRRNKSTNRMLVFNGESRCIAEWADITGISQDTIKDRINKLKWSVDRALTDPVKSRTC